MLATRTTLAAAAAAAMAAEEAAAMTSATTWLQLLFYSSLGRQWYSTSGADSGTGLTPKRTATNPWRS